MRVLIELRVPKDASDKVAMDLSASFGALPGVTIDAGYRPVPVRPTPSMQAALDEADERVVVVRAEIDADKLQEVKSLPGVVKVYTDSKISHFNAAIRARPPVASHPFDVALTGTCPIAPCDCDPGRAKGDIAAVATYIGVDQLWNDGFRGQGMVIGIVDGGITAQGRAIAAGETNKLVEGVIGGFPEADWGTTAKKWGNHGNMTATDARGMAPDARLLDLRISDADQVDDLISGALAAYDWAIRRYRIDGTPQVLSNSWGIYQESWAPDYARDPDHPFTRKVLEALDEGILVLFAAGNCGGACPDGRCGDDKGPGKSIWGANGHARVMTVGAVNSLGRFIGYSSQGPAALHSQKPDFCSISHFAGYMPVDTGTSAACPIAAGAVTLLKQAFPERTQDEIRGALQRTASDIGPGGWDPHAGFGIIRVNSARDALARAVEPPPASEPERSGVQFSGSVPAGATYRFRTRDWPADAQVVWTVVPMTNGSGAPQIEWTVSISKETNGTLTYWISVTNTTAEEIAVEGRYAIVT